MTKREKIESRIEADKPVSYAKAEEPVTDLFKPDPIMELEISRRISRQSVHYGARILADAAYLMTAETRVQYTLIISSLLNLRDHLDELSPIAQAAQFFVEGADPGGTH